jgi:hypothetical protein
MPGIDDQIFNQRVGWWWLKTKKKRVRGIEGGLNIAQHLSYTRNSSVGWRGAKEEIPLPDQNPLKEVSYAWKHLTGGLPIYKDDERRNRGSNAIDNWAETLINNFTETFRDMMGAALFAAGGQGVLDGLAAICSASNVYPTADDEQQVPGVNRALAANAWWRANAGAAHLDGDGNTKGPYNTVEPWSVNGGTEGGWWEGYKDCSNGAEHPDLIICHSVLYGKFEASLLPNERYTNAKVAEVGFENLVYKGATVVMDDDAGCVGVPGAVGTQYNAFILTTDKIDICPDTVCENGLIIDPRHPLETIRADRVLAEWCGNLTCHRPNRQCLISGKT